MIDFQAIADRVEIEALRGEFSDAVAGWPPLGAGPQRPCGAGGCRR
jgi:hypothetical protein